MKKLSVFIGMSVLLFSCTSKEETVLKKMEDKLKSQLMDPLSYQLIEKKIDTVYSYEHYQQLIDLGNEMYSHSKKMANEYDSMNKQYHTTEFNKDIKKFKKEMEDYEMGIAKYQDSIRIKGPKSIQYLVGKFKYRAKNGFGALIIGNSNVSYSIEKDSVTYIKTIKD